MAGIALEEDVKKLIADIIELDATRIDPNAHLVEDLRMDSMMALEILAALEKKFKIKIPEADLPNITTVNKAIELVKKYAR